MFLDWPYQWFWINKTFNIIFTNETMHYVLYAHVDVREVSVKTTTKQVCVRCQQFSVRHFLYFELFTSWDCVCIDKFHVVDIVRSIYSCNGQFNCGKHRRRGGLLWRARQRNKNPIQHFMGGLRTAGELSEVLIGHHDIRFI